MLLIFSGKGGPDAALKKILQKQKNPKHYDDLNRAMRTGGQKLCANEMQSFVLNHKKEIRQKIVSVFHDFIAYTNMILDPYPSADFGGLACSPLRDLKPWVF